MQARKQVVQNETKKIFNDFMQHYEENLKEIKRVTAEIKETNIPDVLSKEFPEVTEEYLKNLEEKKNKYLKLRAELNKKKNWILKNNKHDFEEKERVIVLAKLGDQHEELRKLLDSANHYIVNIHYLTATRFYNLAQANHNAEERKSLIIQAYKTVLIAQDIISSDDSKVFFVPGHFGNYALTEKLNHLQYKIIYLDNLDVGFNLLNAAIQADSSNIPADFLEVIKFASNVKISELSIAVFLEYGKKLLSQVAFANVSHLNFLIASSKAVQAANNYLLMSTKTTEYTDKYISSIFNQLVMTFQHLISYAQFYTQNHWINEAMCFSQEALLVLGSIQQLCQSRYPDGFVQLNKLGYGSFFNFGHVPHVEENPVPCEDSNQVELNKTKAQKAKVALRSVQLCEPRYPAVQLNRLMPQSSKENHASCKDLKQVKSDNNETKNGQLVEQKTASFARLFRSKSFDSYFTNDHKQKSESEQKLKCL